MTACRHITRAGAPCKRTQVIGHACVQHADNADHYYEGVIDRLLARHMSDIEFYMRARSDLLIALADARRGAA